MSAALPVPRSRRVTVRTCRAEYLRAGREGVEITHPTWKPWRGCTKASPGSCSTLAEAVHSRAVAGALSRSCEGEALMNSTARVSLLAAALYLVGGLPARADHPVLVAGGGDGPDGTPAVRARLREPFGVAFDRDGNLYLVELSGQRAGKVDPRGILSTVAGTGSKGDAGDGEPALKARFNGMHSLAVAANGDVYLADTWNNRVRKIEAKTGAISTVVGTGEKGYGGDGGPATEAKFGGIYCAAFDPKKEKLYLADLDNRRIRVLDL